MSENGNPPVAGGDTMSIMFGLMAYICMVVGMGAHGAYNHLTDQVPWTWSAYGAAFVISPIVFYAFMSVLRSGLDNLTAALISFQNGFFWKEIFQAAGPLSGGTG